MPDNLKATIEGALPHRTKSKAENSDLQETKVAVTEPVDFPFTISDLEYRNDSLHQALDLRAIVLRVK